MRTLALSLLLLLVGVGFGVGCAPEDASDDAPTQPGIDLSDPATRTYDVRGYVYLLPDPSRPSSEFRIDHEAIPDFVNIDGEVTGMKAMDMPFPRAPGVSIDGLEVGDPVAFTFAVNWESDGSYPWELIAIRKLSGEEAEGIVGMHTP
jgi:hypothetical protein